MNNKWLLTMGLVLVLAMVGLAGCSPNGTLSGNGINVSSQQNGIWVNGEGKVTAVPDIATLSVGIEAQETSVAQAQSEATKAMNDVMAALKSNGIAEKDIQTQYFNISRVTRWDNDKQQEILIGYRVTNVVTAKIRKIENTGTVIDAVASAGGDLTRINNIQFSLDDPTNLYEQAREKAMTDARNTGRQLASLAGVTLGGPTYISENVQYPPIIMRDLAFAKEAAAPATTPISPGELDVTVNIQVVYAIR